MNSEKPRHSFKKLAIAIALILLAFGAGLFWPTHWLTQKYVYTETIIQNHYTLLNGTETTNETVYTPSNDTRGGFVRAESELYQYRDGVLILYVDPNDRVTNIGRNFTLIKLLSWGLREPPLIVNKTVGEYVANFTAVSFGYTTSVMGNASTQLTSETARVTCPAGNFSYVTTPTAYRINMTVYWRPASGGSMNATGVQWSTTASSNNNLFCYDNGYGTTTYLANDLFILKEQIYINTL